MFGIKMKRIFGLTFTVSGIPPDFAVPGQSNDSVSILPLTGLCNRPVWRYSIEQIYKSFKKQYL